MAQIIGSDSDSDIKNRLIKMFKYYIKEHPEMVTVESGNQISIILDDHELYASGERIIFTNMADHKFKGNAYIPKSNYTVYVSKSEDGFLIEDLLTDSKEELEEAILIQYQKITGEKIDSVLDSEE